ncbi:hypothetical protein [Janthinobacterium sp. MDT1-19]|uniref:hypothetical protein n=1 Tax=Janthinobacterium sp. MDT1-19 TaxID=1259339 RepID=UPI003F21ED45
MAKFSITAYPCVIFPTGIVQIEITRRVAHKIIECAAADLTAELQAIGEAHIGDMPSLHIYATPEGRAPNGWRKFEAEKKNTLDYV